MNITIGPIKNKATWRAVVRKAQAMGYRWRDGDDSLADEEWDTLKEESYITLGKLTGHFLLEVSEEDISLSNKSCAENLGFPIITPDKYLFGVDPGDKFIYRCKEVEYIGYDFKKRWNYLIKFNDSLQKRDSDLDEKWKDRWDSDLDEKYKKRTTNRPKVGTYYDWAAWIELEPVEEERVEISRVTCKLTEETRNSTIQGELRENPYLKFKNLTSSDEQNKSEEKTMLQKLTNALKKHLQPNIKKQYKAGFRNGDLELTQKGVKVLVEEILADKFEKELTEKAEEIIKEHEEE